MQDIKPGRKGGKGGKRLMLLYVHTAELKFLVPHYQFKLDCIANVFLRHPQKNKNKNKKKNFIITLCCNHHFYSLFHKILYQHHQLNSKIKQKTDSHVYYCHRICRAIRVVHLAFNYKTCFFNMVSSEKQSWSQHAMRKAQMIDKNIDWSNPTVTKL